MDVIDAIQTKECPICGSLHKVVGWLPICVICLNKVPSRIRQDLFRYREGLDGLMEEIEENKTKWGLTEKEVQYIYVGSIRRIK